MPPLRKHKTDIVLIAKHLIKEINLERGFMISGISPEMLSYLDQSNWECGNVRELKNFLEHQATEQNGEGYLKLNEHVHPYVETPLAASGENLNDYLKKIRWKRIKEVWEKCGRNKLETAKKLGTPRRQLYRYLDDYESRYGKKLLK